MRVYASRESSFATRSFDAGFPPLGLFVILTAALVYTGILTWEDPIGKMLDEGEKKTGEVASVVSNKEVELVA